MLHAQPPTTKTTDTYCLWWYNTYIPRVGSWTSCLPQHQPVWVHQLFGLRLRRGGIFYNWHHGSTDWGRCTTCRKGRRSGQYVKQELQDERALPQTERRAHKLIDQEIHQLHKNLNAQQLLQDAVTAQVRRASELLGYLNMHSTKPGSEPNNLLRQLQRSNIGWEMFRQLRHQYAAGARIQQHTLLQSTLIPLLRTAEMRLKSAFALSGVSDHQAWAPNLLKLNVWRSGATLNSTSDKFSHVRDSCLPLLVRAQHQ